MSDICRPQTADRKLQTQGNSVSKGYISCRTDSAMFTAQCLQYSDRWLGQAEVPFIVREGGYWRQTQASMRLTVQVRDNCPSHRLVALKLCSHGTSPKWIRPYPGTDHFCSHGTVPLINVRPHGTGLLWFGTESK